MRARIISTTALAIATIALPALASAQTLLNTLGFFNQLLNALIGLLITLAIVAFFWGLVKYLFISKGDEASRKSAMNLMIYGVIVIFVMVSIWGIIRLLQSTFSVTSTTPVIPQGIQVNPGY